MGRNKVLTRVNTFLYGGLQLLSTELNAARTLSEVLLVRDGVLCLENFDRDEVNFIITALSTVCCASCTNLYNKCKWHHSMCYNLPALSI